MKENPLVPENPDGNEPDGLPGIVWLERDRIGGMPRPGVTPRCLKADLEAVAQRGVSMVVSLTAEWTPPRDVFDAAGLESIHVPIPDWEPPTLRQAEETCDLVSVALAAGRTVIFHCQAGRGRTGTMLAAVLIWADPDCAAAVGRVRAANPDWIETDAQLDFLKEFAAYRRGMLGNEAHIVGAPRRERSPEGGS